MANPLKNDCENANIHTHSGVGTFIKEIKLELMWINSAMEWNAQGKCITYRAFHFTGHRCVEKFITGFKIDGRTIKRVKLVCIAVI